MRAFDDNVKRLLRSPSMKLRLLMTFYLDQGTYRFCDDFVDCTDGTNTWIGASPLGGQVEIKSGKDLSAEPITLTLDGNKMAQAGVKDPARVLSDIMGYLFTQRRTDFAFGISWPDSMGVNALIPCAAMKINTCRLVDKQLDWLNPSKEVESSLEIVFDSLAMRYSRATFRTRSDPDQREIDATDSFFSFTADAVNTEKTLYWGKRAPTNLGGGGGVPFIPGPGGFLVGLAGGPGSSRIYGGR